MTNEWDPRNDPRNGPAYPYGYPRGPLPYVRKKKWVAGLLAFFIPGTGHFYLGQMIKGVAIMLLIALDICAIVFAGTQLDNVLVIVLLSLFMPIIYFYSLFDAIQMTDIVNERWHQAGGAYPATTYGYQGQGPYMGQPNVAARAPSPEPPEPAGNASETGPDGAMPQPAMPMESMRGSGSPIRSINGPGVILLAAGAVILILATNSGLVHNMFQSTSSMIGAVVLIGAGIGLWFWEMRGGHGRNK